MGEVQVYCDRNRTYFNSKAIANNLAGTLIAVYSLLQLANSSATLSNFSSIVRSC